MAETRKFLKGLDLNQILNTPLLQFVKDLFNEIGLGELEFIDKKNYQYTFRVKTCPVCGLFRDIPNKKVCQPTVDAIQRFFSEAMGLEGDVEELTCVNVGGENCEFKIDLQPFTVLEKALDKTDLDILQVISHAGSIDVIELSDKLHLDEDEFKNRLQYLQYYEILTDDFKLTEVGMTFYNYRSNTTMEEEKDFDPPWKSMAELTSTIAATQSFAEALVVVAEEEELPWEVDEIELVDIKERAKEKGSSAELLSTELKNNSENDDE